jgi:hypothetical protein
MEPADASRPQDAARAAREEIRAKMADHARRQERVKAGLLYWTEEEWEKIISG